MKNLLKLIAVMALTLSAFGQFQSLGPNVANNLVGSTTLSGAVTSTSANQWCVASATGIVTPSLSASNLGSYLFADGEAAQVTGTGATTTCFAVRRGQLGTRAQLHATAAIVWIGNQSATSGDTSRPFGGRFFPLDNADPGYLATPQPVFGGPAASAAAPVAGSLYVSELIVEHNRPVKAICLMNGATAGGTDNHIFFIYDHAGNLLGQTAATATSGTTQLQCQNLATPIEISGGPRVYFIGFQSNGTTDLIQKYTTGQVGSNYHCGSQTGTSGTIPATINPPFTFTTATCPIGGIQ